MKRILYVVLGVASVLVGLGIAMPAFAKLKSYDAIPTCGLLFLGLVIITGGLGSAIYGIVRRNAQRA